VLGKEEKGEHFAEGGSWVFCSCTKGERVAHLVERELKVGANPSAGVEKKGGVGQMKRECTKEIVQEKFRQRGGKESVVEGERLSQQKKQEEDLPKFKRKRNLGQGKYEEN